MNARNRSSVLEALMFLLPGLKRDSIAVTGPIQCIHGWDHTTFVHVCICLCVCVHIYAHKHSLKLRQTMVKKSVC